LRLDPNRTRNTRREQICPSFGRKAYSAVFERIEQRWRLSTKPGAVNRFQFPCLAASLAEYGLRFIIQAICRQIINRIRRELEIAVGDMNWIQTHRGDGSGDGLRLDEMHLRKARLVQF